VNDESGVLALPARSALVGVNRDNDAVMEFGAGIEPAVARALTRYLQVLGRANAVMNLTAARDAAALGAHVRDALTLVPFVVTPLVDVGSGGGFPALPLALACGIDVTLVESVAKKARFLREAAAELGLHCNVRAERAEDAARSPELREQFATATARAVGPATTVLELTVPFLRIGGAAVLQRGRLAAEERAAVNDAALVLGAELEAELSVGAPGDERRILIVRKRRATGARFPRRAGMPARKPLCWNVPEDA